jgi:hypothetical protein
MAARLEGGYKAVNQKILVKITIFHRAFAVPEYRISTRKEYEVS